MSEPSNQDRANWALTAVRGFADETGLDWREVGDLETAIGDLLINLLHLAESRFGVRCAERLHGSALNMYHMEREDG